MSGFDDDRQFTRAARGPHAVVVIGGHPPDRRVLGSIPADHQLICADSGLDHALRLGLSPSVVIGDMDSVHRSSLDLIRDSGCSVLEYPTHKDSTDTELALAHAVETGHRTITVVWGGGDRIDHVLGVVAALGHPRLSSLESLRVWLGPDRMDIVHSGRELTCHLDPDTLVSLVPIGSGDPTVSTQGLKWELVDSRLHSDAARGLSNVVLSSPLRVRVSSGVVAVVIPDCLSAVDVPFERMESGSTREGRP